MRPWPAGSGSGPQQRCLTSSTRPPASKAVLGVVFASSLHVTGFYDASERINPEMPVRPDSFYGVDKACGEEPGRLYADKHGLQVVCVHIGTFAERPRTPRHLSTWLSPGDAVELFWRCLVAPDIGFTVVYGTSATRRGWWDPGLGRAARLAAAG